jgi:hypothetical protein
MSAKKDSAPAPDELDSFELVRPGLGETDAELDPERPETVGEQLQREVDALAPSPTRKRKLRDRDIWARQERFLEAFSSLGTTVHACEASKVSQRTVRDWRKSDRLGFIARMDGSAESFADRLEALAIDHCRRLKPGQNPTLILALLNARRASSTYSQFRPTAAVDPLTARETLSELRHLSSSIVGPEGPDNEAATSSAVAEAEELIRSKSSATPGAALIPTEDESHLGPEPQAPGSNEGAI